MAKARGAATDSDFLPAPEGQHLAVCCDVQDLGLVETNWKGQVKKRAMIRLVFQLDPKTAGMPEKYARFIVSQRFTNSLYDNAHLRRFLRSWKGQDLTPEQVRDGFDLDVLIGKSAVVQVLHSVDSQGRTWANIDTIMKAPPGQTLGLDPDYVRMQDREDYVPPEGAEGWEEHLAKLNAGGGGKASEGGLDQTPDALVDDDDDLDWL